jgi:P-type Cu+ transporter
MFNIFKKKAMQGEKVVFKLSGLHCASCAMSIDNALEEVEGVHESKTSFAKTEAVVHFDPQKTNHEELKRAIQGAGYQVDL